MQSSSQSPMFQYSVLRAGCPSCRSNNNVKTLKSGILLKEAQSVAKTAEMTNSSLQLPLFQITLTLMLCRAGTCGGGKYYRLITE